MVNHKFNRADTGNDDLKAGTDKNQSNNRITRNNNNQANATTISHNVSNQ